MPWRDPREMADNNDSARASLEAAIAALQSERASLTGKGKAAKRRRKELIAETRELMAQLDALDDGDDEDEEDEDEVMSDAEPEQAADEQVRW